MIGARGRVLAAPVLAVVVAVTLLAAFPGAASAASDVQVTALDCESHPRRIAIQNKGDTAQSLAGWKLLSDKPNEVFDLGAVGQVGPGETFYVFNGHLAPLAPIQLGGQWVYGWNPSEVFDPALFVLDPNSADFIRLVDASQFPWREVSALPCESTTQIPPLQQPPTPTPSSTPDPGSQSPSQTDQPSSGGTATTESGAAAQNVPAGNTATGSTAQSTAQTGNVSGQAAGGPASGVGALAAGSGGSFLAAPLPLAVVSLALGAALALIGALTLRRALRRPRDG